MKKFSALVFALLAFTSLIAKEYPTKKDLFENTGNAEVNKRNWTHADRENESEEWKESCLFNFSYATGFMEYKTMDQREDFLEWLSLELKRKGHEVKWVDLVLTVTDLIEPAAKGNSLVSLNANLGNKIVFDSSFSRLQTLFRMEKGLKGADAKAWDDEMIVFEQEQLIQPIFNRMDIVTLEKVTKMAKGEGLYSLVTKDRLNFPGDLRSSTDRINYAQQILLPYVIEKTNADLKSSVAAQNIEAEDARSMKAAEQYLKRLEKESGTTPEPEEKVIKVKKVKEPKAMKERKSKKSESEGIQVLPESKNE